MLWPNSLTLRLIDSVRLHGGFSENVLTGEPPTTGYMVARKDSGFTMPESLFFGPVGYAAVKAYCDAINYGGGDYIGAWLDSGTVYVERSDNIRSFVHAMHAGYAAGQKAIYHVEEKRDIPC